MHGSLERPYSGLLPTKRREIEGEDPDNWVAYFDRAQSCEGLGPSYSWSRQWASVSSMLSS
jgi:hypothetical protein